MFGSISGLRRKNYDDINEDEFITSYRFTKNEIEELCSVLQVPERLKLENNDKVNGKLCFCILLDKLVSGMTISRLQIVYGIHKTTISRIIVDMLYFLDQKMSHTLVLRRCILNKYGQYFSHCLFNKGVPIPNCIGFIDGTCRQIARPVRHQKQLYNGHKRYSNFI